MSRLKTSFGTCETCNIRSFLTSDWEEYNHLVMEQVGYASAPQSLNAVFAALADPTRRAILSRLVKGDAAVNELAEPFEMSQPAVSKHLKVLERAGLIERAIDKQRRPARLKPQPLAEAVDWLEDFRKHWSTQFDQLDSLLDELKATEKRTISMSDLPTFVLDRVFDAPRDLVWKTFTDPNLLARWYGPNVETVIHQLDVTPGGLWLNEMRMGKGSHYERMEYLEVAAPERLVWRHSAADAGWNITANPMMPDWPKVLLTTVIFTEEDGQTRMRLTWVPEGASEAEIACFANALAGLGKGWGAGMEVLTALLKELQTG